MGRSDDWGVRDWREFVSGFLAANINILVTYPIHKTTFRQVVHHISVPEALKQLKQEGPLILYRGVFSPLALKCATTSIMFGTYSQYSRLIRENTPIQNQILLQATAAVFAGWTEATLTPLERVQALMQDSKNHHRYKNTIDALKQLGRHYGFAEYYRGLTAVLWRNGPTNAIFFVARERLNVTESSLPRQFVTGACIGAFISTAFYPLNVVRTHMMIVVGGPFVSVFKVFSSLFVERGMQGMFKGVHINYTRSFLSWGIINVAYERIHAALKRL